MLKVQHLVIDDVLNRVARHQELVKDAADDDRIVRRIVVPKNSPRLRGTPTHARPPQQAMKKSPIQILENSIEIVEASLWRMQLLASAHLPHQVGLSHQLVAAHIFSIAGRLAG